ncbi:hypothetical protein [Streptomyces cyaneofuscatus]|uniref:hypothetical protein n=1 Tax=Streptomyces cyaneofuscatus TaxID=66883 RepID=UPI002FF37349
MFSTYLHVVVVAVWQLNGRFLTVSIAVLVVGQRKPNIRGKLHFSNQIYKDSTTFCGVKGEPEAAAERNEVSTERVRIQA